MGLTLIGIQPINLSHSKLVSLSASCSHSQLASQSLSSTISQSVFQESSQPVIQSTSQAASHPLSQREGREGGWQVIDPILAETDGIYPQDFRGRYAV